MDTNGEGECGGKISTKVEQIRSTMRIALVGKKG